MKFAFGIGSKNEDSLCLTVNDFDKDVLGKWCNLSFVERRWIWTKGGQLMNMKTLECIEVPTILNNLPERVQMKQCDLNSPQQKLSCQNRNKLFRGRFDIGQKRVEKAYPQFSTDSNQHLVANIQRKRQWWKTYFFWRSSINLCSKEIRYDYVGCYRFADGFFLRTLSDQNDFCSEHVENILAPIFVHHSSCSLDWANSKYLHGGYPWASAKGNGNYFSLEPTNKTSVKRLRVKCDAFKIWNGSIIKLNITCKSKGNKSHENHCLLFKFETLPKYSKITSTAVIESTTNERPTTSALTTTTTTPSPPPTTTSSSTTTTPSPPSPTTTTTTTAATSLSTPPKTTKASSSTSATTTVTPPPPPPTPTTTSSSTTTTPSPPSPPTTTRAAATSLSTPPKTTKSSSSTSATTTLTPTPTDHNILRLTKTTDITKIYTSSPTSTKSDLNSGSSSTATIAIVIPIVILVIILCLVVGMFVFHKRRKRRQPVLSTNEEMQSNEVHNSQRILYEDPSQMYEPLRKERRVTGVENPYEGLVGLDAQEMKSREVQEDPSQIYEPLRKEQQVADVENLYQGLVGLDAKGASGYDYIAEKGTTNPGADDGEEYTYARSDNIPRSFAAQPSQLSAPVLYQTLDDPELSDNQTHDNSKPIDKSLNSTQKPLGKSPVYQTLEESEVVENPRLKSDNEMTDKSLDSVQQSQLNKGNQNPVYQTLEGSEAVENPRLNSDNEMSEKNLDSVEESLNQQSPNPVYQTLEKPNNELNEKSLCQSPVYQTLENSNAGQNTSSEAFAYSSVGDIISG